MDPEDRKLLEKAVRLSEETDDTVKKMYRRVVIGGWIRVIYWVVIIGAAIGIFYFLDPFIDQAIDIYGGFGAKVQDVNSFLDSLNKGSQ